MTRSRSIVLVVVSGVCAAFTIICSIVAGGEAASVAISVPPGDYRCDPVVHE